MQILKVQYDELWFIETFVTTTQNNTQNNSISPETVQFDEFWHIDILVTTTQNKTRIIPSHQKPAKLSAQESTTFWFLSAWINLYFSFISYKWNHTLYTADPWTHVWSWVHLQVLKNINIGNYFWRSVKIWEKHFLLPLL